MAMPKIAFLECSLCHHRLDASLPQTVCTECAGTLYVRYDLSAAAGLEQRGLVGKQEQDGRWSGMWRYRQVLPDVAPITLGEGWTPMLQSRRNANVWLKEEGANPTGTFKARGLALAVTMASHYGLKKLAAPSAGNAGGALSRICSGRRNRSAYFHAEGCTAGQPGGVHGLWGEADSRGRAHL